MAEPRIKFVYKHGDAEGGLLNLYDGAKSLEGIARALTISTHALVNGEVRTRADSATNADLYILAPRRGSFVYEAAIYLGGVITSGLFYDFIKFTFNEAIGNLLDEPQTRSLQARIEPTMGELPAVLENALVDVHRPMVRSNDIVLNVTRPRGEVLATFNSTTAQALQPQEEDLPDPIIGHVTRYNTISHWGRLYDVSQARVISFVLKPDLTEHEKSLITWSLHQANIGAVGKLYFNGTAIVTPLHRVIKRYNISSVSQVPI